MEGNSKTLNFLKKAVGIAMMVVQYGRVIGTGVAIGSAMSGPVGGVVGGAVGAYTCCKANEAIEHAVGVGIEAVASNTKEKEALSYALENVGFLIGSKSLVKGGIINTSKVTSILGEIGERLRNPFLMNQKACGVVGYVEGVAKGAEVKSFLKNEAHVEKIRVKEVAKGDMDLRAPVVCKIDQKIADVKNKLDYKPSKKVEPVEVKQPLVEKVVHKKAYDPNPKLDVAKKKDVKVQESGQKKPIKEMNQKTEYRGGKFKTLKPQDGMDKHHMPADSSTQINRNDGPSIHMDRKDHKLTSSNGQMKNSKQYRSEIKELMDSGKGRDAMAKEVLDIKNKFGTKYNKPMGEMLEYAKTLDEFKK